jgi:hypothetical protein
MAKYIAGKGWVGKEPISRFHEIAESGQAPVSRISTVNAQRGDEVVYYSQLADKPNDPKAWMSHDDAKRVCDKKGYQFSPMKSFAN